MASVIQICNIALMRIGSSRTINSLSEQSKQADVANVFYESSRDTVLSDFDWNFASKRVALADLDTPSTDWQFAYRYPTDCMRITEIMTPGIRYPAPGMRVTYEVGADAAGTGKIIYTNQPEAQLRYVGKITDPNMFDAQFADALSWKLAAEFAMPLAASGDLGNKALQMYNAMVLAGVAHSNNESQEPLVPESEFTIARLS